MEDLAEIAKILNTAGYNLTDCQAGFICITDPTCVWPPLLNFINTAWIIISVITVFLLAGWGITMVRGANHDMITNLRTLVLIFGMLSAAIPIANMLGGGKAVVNQCDIIKISQEHAQELLQLRNQSKWQQDNYEIFDIKDSADQDFLQENTEDDFNDEDYSI